jgi:S-adenosylmethionine:tRNA-ribosyltransferase-isomerase (queuine synthetase)
LEKKFFDIADILPDDRVLVFNRSKVMPARVILPRIKAILPTGSEFEIENLEILIVNLIDEKHAE